MRRAARVDSNHAAVAGALRLMGWHVEDTSRLGRGFPDLVCGKQGRVELVEVKDGSKAKSQRALTADEQRVIEGFARHGVTVRIIETIEQAIQL